MVLPFEAELGERLLVLLHVDVAQVRPETMKLYVKISRTLVLYLLLLLYLFFCSDLFHLDDCLLIVSKHVTLKAQDPRNPLTPP